MLSKKGFNLIAAKPDNIKLLMHRQEINDMIYYDSVERLLLLVCAGKKY